MAQDWDIKPRSNVCHKCERPFEDRQPYFSALVFEEKSGYVRADYCFLCWHDMKTDASPYSSWRGTFHVPPPPKEEALKKETAESLLREFMSGDDPSRKNVIYILAVMLERRKTLVERDVRKKDNGELLRVYEHRGTGETFIIPDPGLELDRLEDIQQEVVKMLSGSQSEKLDLSGTGNGKDTNSAEPCSTSG